MNDHDIVTGEFTLQHRIRIPTEDLRAWRCKPGCGRARAFGYFGICPVMLGISIYSNMVLLGMAWQGGLVPLPPAALLEAVRLNGASRGDLRAFELGRLRRLFRSGAGDAGARRKRRRTRWFIAPRICAIGRMVPLAARYRRG